MPHFLCLDQAFHLQIRQMMADRDGIDIHSLSQFIDRDLGAAEQCLKNFVFRAFYAEEYNRASSGCQYTR